ncbi:MAG: hypothetical protein GXO73_00275 [Calditrichaeota bacterium]|nr:hypothetical protein [Calditrichota bacterium]
MADAVRLMYYGNQNVGAACLEELLAHDGIDVVGAVVLDPFPDETLKYRSVRQVAEAAGVPVYAPEDINSEAFVSFIRDQRVDYGISVAWRKIFKPPLIQAHKKGILNFHGAYLPGYRGANPTNWAVLRGARSTGVTVHFVDEGVDTGPIVLQKRLEIGPEETAWQVRQRQDALSVELMRELVGLLKGGELRAVPQDLRRGRTYGIRKPEDGLLNFEKPARELYNQIRALTKPYPGAFTYVQGRKLVIWWAEVVSRPEGPGVFFRCGDGKYLKVVDAETVS